MASLTFSYSSMNAGKSLSLIKIFYDFAEETENGVNSDNIICLTSSLDDRFGLGKIRSRPLAATLDAIPVGLDDDIVTIVEDIKEKSKKDIELILVDEAQFFSEEQILQMCLIVDKLNINIMCFGLRTNFKGEFFEGSSALLRYADKIREIKNKCSHKGCIRKAIMNARIDSEGEIIRDGEEIEIGAESKYKSVCRYHFLSGF